MNAVRFEVELPSDLILALNLEHSQLGHKAREWIVLQLFQEGAISAGKAAEILGRSKADFLQLLDGHRLPYLDWAPEELEAEAKVALAATGTAGVV